MGSRRVGRQLPGCSPATFANGDASARVPGRVRMGIVCPGFARNIGGIRVGREKKDVLSENSTSVLFLQVGSNRKKVARPSGFRSAARPMPAGDRQRATCVAGWKTRAFHACATAPPCRPPAFYAARIPRPGGSRARNDRLREDVIPAHAGIHLVDSRIVEVTSGKPGSAPELTSSWRRCCFLLSVRGLTIK